MKVKFNFGIGAFSGTIKEGVYKMCKGNTSSIMRLWVKPRRTVQNDLIGAVGANLGNLWKNDASAGYKADMKEYAQRYYGENIDPNGFDPSRSTYGFFTKAMWNWQADDPEHVDLSTVTGADVDSLGTKIASVKACIDNGMLPSITNFSDLTEAF